MSERNAPAPRIKGLTPVVTLIWPKLSAADKFNKMGTKARFSAEAFAKFEAQFAEVHAAAVANGEVEFEKLPPATRKKLKTVQVNDLGTPVFDDSENETGEYDVNFSITASGKDKKGEEWTARPIPAFDAKGHRLSPAQTEKVWSGSQARIAFEIDPTGYFVPGTGACGIKFKPVAVQVIALASGGSNRSSSSFGFGSEEGFSADELGTDEAAANDNEAAPTLVDAASDF